MGKGTDPGTLAAAETMAAAPWDVRPHGVGLCRREGRKGYGSYCTSTRSSCRVMSFGTVNRR